MADRPDYKLVLFYTVELAFGLTLELDSLSDAQNLFNCMRMARCENSDATLNLVAWSGRNDGRGGPPTGLILEQHTWNADG